VAWVTAPGRRAVAFCQLPPTEEQGFAGRVHDRLADRFGEGQVFIDVDAPGPAAEDDGPSGQYPDWCCSVLARAKISAPIGVVTSALVRRRPASL